MDLVRDLVNRRIKELGLNRVQVSRLLDHNPTYIQDFLTKGSPKELPERERGMLAQILRVPEDELRGPSATLPRRKNEKTLSNSLATETRGRSYSGVPESQILAGSEIIGSVADLPVFGTGPQDVQSGGFILSELAVDWEVRPPKLARVRDAYAVIVPRNVMEPAIRAGAVVMIHPHLPPRIGDFCVWRLVKDGTTYIQGGEYRGETADSWKVRHYNPAKDFTLKKSEWTVCHRSIGVYFT